MKTTEGAKDLLVVCVVARILPVIFVDDVDVLSFHGELTAASKKAHELITEIHNSYAHQFHSPNGDLLGFYPEVYVPYLKHVCCVIVRLMDWYQAVPFAKAKERMMKIQESKGFEELLGNCNRPGQTQLDDPDLDLEVDYVVPFTFVYSG